MNNENEEELVKKILENAEARMQPDAERMNSARTAFLNAWQSEYGDVERSEAHAEPTSPNQSSDSKVTSIMAARKPRRKWQMGVSIAASVLVSAIVFMLYRNDAHVLPDENVSVATLESFRGDVSVNGIILNERGAFGQLLPKGSSFETGQQGFLRVRLANTASLRLDNNTVVTLAPSGLNLQRGRVYVDAPGDADSTTITAGSFAVTDIGTQFEVSHQQGKLTIGVREGEVQIRDTSRQVPAKSVVESVDRSIDDLKAVATQSKASIVTIVNGQVVDQHELSTNDVYWNWVHSAPMEMELSTVSKFLELAAREFGLRLEYSSNAVLLASQSTQLSGKIILDETLEQRINEILSAASFQRLNADPELLRIDFIRH